MSSGKKETLSVSLPSEMIEWLDTSVQSHSLSSRSKAIRCCVNCVALGDVKMIEPVGPSANYRAVDIELAPEQVKWIDHAVSKSMGSSQSQLLQFVVEACRKAEQHVVFGVIRCKSKISACDGAQEAVDLLAKRYGENNVEVKEEIKLL